jgi:hypothetical protein
VEQAENPWKDRKIESPIRNISAWNAPAWRSGVEAHWPQLHALLIAQYRFENETASFGGIPGRYKEEILSIFSTTRPEVITCRGSVCNTYTGVVSESLHKEVQYIDPLHMHNMRWFIENSLVSRFDGVGEELVHNENCWLRATG